MQNRQPDNKKKPTDLPPKDSKRPTSVEPSYGTYATQPITKADSRYPKTNVACPDDVSVDENREWVMHNKK